MGDMKLAAYLEHTNLTKGSFGEKIGCRAEAVRRYCAGERIPKRDVMLAIMRATEGAVGPADFYPSMTEAA